MRTSSMTGAAPTDAAYRRAFRRLLQAVGALRDDLDRLGEHGRPQSFETLLRSIAGVVQSGAALALLDEQRAQAARRRRRGQRATGTGGGKGRGEGTNGTGTNGTGTRGSKQASRVIYLG